MATLTPSIFALTLALIEGQGWGWGSGRILGLFAAAILFLIAFVVAENRQANPMVHFPMFRSPAFLAANVITFVLTFGMFGTIFFLTLYMQNVLGYSAIQSGLRTLPMTALIIFSAPLSGRLVGRFGGRPIVFTGLTLVGLGLLIDSRRLTAYSSYTVLLPSFILIGIGIGFAMSPLSTIAMGAVERTKAGVASGVLGMVRQLGGVFGIALLGAIFANRSHAHVVSRVAALPVPDAVKAQIVANASLGKGSGTLPGADPALVLRIKDAVLGGVVQWADGRDADRRDRLRDRCGARPDPHAARRGGGDARSGDGDRARTYRRTGACLNICAGWGQQSIRWPRACVMVFKDGTTTFEVQHERAKNEWVVVSLSRMIFPMSVPASARC